MPSSPNTKAENKKGQKLAPKIANAAMKKPKLSPVTHLKIEYNRTFVSTSRDYIGANAEYDLELIESVVDVESIVARVLNRMKAVSWKSGSYIKVSDNRVSEYLEKRLLEMYLIQLEDFDSILKEAYKHLLMYGNAFIIKIRDKSRSSGKEHKMFGKVLEPIAGLEIADPTTMSPIRKVSKGALMGRVIGWQQVIHEQELKDLKLEDVIHITLNKKSSHIFGTPLVTPVLDDIRSLRRLEELTDIGIVKSIFPLLHYRVGNKDVPPAEYENGSTEIDKARVNLNNMGPEDMLITPWTHELSAVNIDGAYLETSEIRKYYIERVVTGMGASLIDIGLSGAATKDTANNISQNLIDLMTDVQDEFSKSVNTLLLELVLEADRYELSKEVIPTFNFETIDWETKHKIETHLLNLTNSGLMTIDEFRRETGRPLLSKEEYRNTVIEKYKKQPETNGVANKANPENQYGKRGSAAKNTTRKDSRMPIIRPIPEGIEAVKNSYRKYKDILGRVFRTIKSKDPSDRLAAKAEWKSRIDSMASVFTNSMVISITQAMNYGASDFYAYHGGESKDQLELLPFFKEVVEDAFRKLALDIDSEAQRLVNAQDSTESDLKTFMQSNEYRIDFIVRSELNAIRNTTFANLARGAGYKNAYWHKRSSCDQCKSSPSTVDLSNIQYNDLRALVPNCGDMLRLNNVTTISSAGCSKACNGSQ